MAISTNQKPMIYRNLYENTDPGADSENLDFAAPLAEHGFNGIFCFFGPPPFILKTLPLSKSVQKTL